MARFSFRKRIESFRYALQGFRILFSEEHNARIHALAAVAAIVVGLILEIAVWEWALVGLSICLVFLAELFNTSIENLCDLIDPNHNPKIGRIKDLSAAAVLFAALFALFTGLLVYGPAFWKML